MRVSMMSSPRAIQLGQPLDHAARRGAGQNRMSASERLAFRAPPTIFPPMTPRWVLAALALIGLGSLIAAESSPRAPNLAAQPKAWRVEQAPGGSVDFREGKIIIRDVGGCTVWLREKLTAPVAVSFTATMLGGDRPTDRVSDLNCFWMAVDSRNANPPFEGPNARSGRFAEYDSLLTYYVGYGANNNTTTRFRRYDGTAERPLRPEHDLKGEKLMLTAGRPVRIRVVARDGVAEYWRDGERIFSFRDPQPLTSGWFAIRTVRSHVAIEDVRIESLNPRASR
jgi:hypothetical protein